MNVQRKPIKRPRCKTCDEVYMMVGSTPIGLAFPRPQTRSYSKDINDMIDDTGICPKHKRGLSD